MSRVLERLDELYAIGATRVGGSPGEDKAHELAARWFEQAGLTVDVDAAGNLFGRRGDASGLDRVSPRLSVPNGGRFDGALGVVAAIEAAGRTDAPLTVVAFRDEERGCKGSRVPASQQEACRGRSSSSMSKAGGPRLALAGEALGVVTTIAGQAVGEVVFEGRADHAGTTPMDARRDALVEAAEFVLRVRAATPPGVATVGRLEVEPGATNVVPARVTVWVDARAGTSDQGSSTRLSQRSATSLGAPSRSRWAVLLSRP